jgi:hypothetical protein
MGKIQASKVRELQEKWAEQLKLNPNKICLHDQGWVKEYDLGADTGDLVCPICGKIK